MESVRIVRLRDSYVGLSAIERRNLWKVVENMRKLLKKLNLTRVGWLIYIFDLFSNIFVSERNLLQLFRH